MLGHIIVVDDDVRIRTLLSQFLIDNGYAISTASNVKECEKLLHEFQFDLIILDIMMPGESGIDFVKRTRSTLKTAVLMLSALGHVDDKVDGLESGAEDYMTKPFEPKELLLRIQKILKRRVVTSDNIKFGEFIFELINNTLSKNGENIHLTQTEKNLLKILGKTMGQMVSREELQKQLSDVNARTIDAQIARLRAKIETDPKSPKHLQTIRGSGYVLFG
jgi:two-component system phosphate regulon response regulator OmpR